MDSHHIAEKSGVQYDDPPVSIAHLMRILGRYRPVVLLVLAVVSVVYVLGVVAYLLIKPTQEITSIRFRLEFRNADTGRYPNGSKFSPATITATPILLDVYHANSLDRYWTFERFSRSIFVLASSPALEQLNLEYQARLAEPRLTPIDRERLLQEFENKRESLAKNEYVISCVRSAGRVPDQIVRKVLSDILAAWARDAEGRQKLMDFPVSVLAPDVIDSDPAEGTDEIISLVMLRSKISRILEDVNALQEAPGSEVVRTQADHISLGEVRLKLEELLRFRLEPLIVAVHNSGLTKNPGLTIQFLESQLAYDQLHLQDLMQTREAIRNSYVVYANRGPIPDTTKEEKEKTAVEGKSNETIMPQLGDTFIDRVVSLANQSSDISFRREVAEQYRRASLYIIPVAHDVAYDQQVLDLVRKGPASSTSLQSAQVRTSIDNMRTEIRRLVAHVGEIHQLLSRTMNPATQLFTVTTPATTTVAHPGDSRRIVLGAVLTLLVSLIVTVILCLIHHRVQEEADDESAEQRAEEVLV